ncbi:hypothetical protein ACTJK5_03885 [Agrobacterium sp. 22094]|uniref:hypothetical protein n=1 Tax=Agrobacterium sp. 22094 TaxID=3453872 RepID=UPI003F8798A8
MAVKFGLLCLAAKLTFFSLAYADNVTCPPSIKPSNPINQRDYRGRELSKEYFFNASGTWLKVPLGHLSPWYGAPLEDITPATPGASEKRMGTGISYAFWMPTLRWPERDTLSIASSRFCENGRKMPEDGEFIVIASIENPWLPLSTSPLRDRLPAERLENTKKNLGAEFSGTKYDLNYYDGSEEAPFDHFFSGSEPSVILQCAKAERVPNPICFGHVWWSMENLGLTVQFSLLDLPRWRENIDAAYELAHRWRKAANNGMVAE